MKNERVVMIQNLLNSSFVFKTHHTPNLRKVYIESDSSSQGSNLSVESSASIIKPS